MLASLKLSKIEENLNKLLVLLVGNQNILRYIKYLDNNPLVKDSSHPDIVDDLIDGESQNIILTPFDPKVLENTQVKIFLNPYEGNLEDDVIGENIYILDIVCPIQNWRIKGKGQLRTFRIADEFCKMVDGQKVAGIGEVKVYRFKTGKIENEYAVLSLWVRVKNPSLKGKG